MNLKLIPTLEFRTSELRTRSTSHDPFPNGYLSCSPAIMTSPLCCLAMVFLLTLFVRSMFAICGLKKVSGGNCKLRPLVVFTQQPLKDAEAPLPCGKDVMYTEKKSSETETCTDPPGRSRQTANTKRKLSAVDVHSLLLFPFFICPG